MSSKRPPAPPPPIPGFKYISLLGSGGFSDVYLYEQDRPRRKVAVKVLLSDLKTEGARRRFESEANLMAQLSSHPYIVSATSATQIVLIVLTLRESAVRRVGLSHWAHRWYAPAGQLQTRQ